MRKAFTHTITDQLYLCEILEQIKLTYGGKTSEECLPGKGYNGTSWDDGNNRSAHVTKVYVFVKT